jgi:hypothetical protein
MNKEFNRFINNIKKNLLIPHRTNWQIGAPFDIVIKCFGENNMHSTFINFLTRYKYNIQ